MAAQDAGEDRGGGLGQLNGCDTEVETYFLSADLDVLDGQSVDRRWPLCVEEEKQSCEAVSGLEGVAVQESRATFHRRSSSSG